MCLASASGRLTQPGPMLLEVAIDHTNLSRKPMRNRLRVSQPRPVAVCWGPMEKKRLPLPIDGVSVRLRPALVLHPPRQTQHLAVEADTLKPPVKCRTHRSQLVREGPTESSGPDALGVTVERDRRIHTIGPNSI